MSSESENSKNKYKVLVANRGEIAIRILRTARELNFTSVAIYAGNDVSHASYADEAVQLSSAGEYMNVEGIVEIARRTKCTHVHPGYGFLSESPLLPSSLAEYGITFIGPSPDALRVASDKILSRELAESLSVPVAPGRRITSMDEVRVFANEVGYPVIIKALDGGGGRGIRVVESREGVEEAYKRCLGESPSHQLLIEKALTGPGWKHIEVQIIGDGREVRHFWERECSVQRRFQKLIETAPSHLPRQTIQPLLDASQTLASKLAYKGLGTFEFLLNTHTSTWVFLEINPRVQVEHTVTEEITNVDLVEMQFRLFMGEMLESMPAAPQPKGYAVQLRLTAEDPEKGFGLSLGTVPVGGVSWPAGRGVRVDTWLSSSSSEDDRGWDVTPEYDSLLAKIILRHPTWDGVCRLAERALEEVSVRGVKTNVDVLRGVVRHTEWRAGKIDTLWLERRLGEVLSLGRSSKRESGLKVGKEEKVTSESGEVLLQPGSTFSLILSPSDSEAQEEKHTITLQSLTTNAFPSSLSGQVVSSFHGSPCAFSLSLSSSAAAAASELADPRNKNHVAVPVGGKVVEMHPALSSLVDAEDKGVRRRVKKGEALLVLSVMKMESVVSAPRDGWVERVGKGVRVGEVVGEGGLVCVFEEEVHVKL